MSRAANAHIRGIPDPSVRLRGVSRAAQAQIRGVDPAERLRKSVAAPYASDPTYAARLAAGSSLSQLTARTSLVKRFRAHDHGADVIARSIRQHRALTKSYGIQSIVDSEQRRFRNLARPYVTPRVSRSAGLFANEAFGGQAASRMAAISAANGLGPDLTKLRAISTAMTSDLARRLRTYPTATTPDLARIGPLSAESIPSRDLTRTLGSRGLNQLAVLASTIGVSQLGTSRAAPILAAMAAQLSPDLSRSLGAALRGVDINGLGRELRAAQRVSSIQSRFRLSGYPYGDALAGLRLTDRMTRTLSGLDIDRMRLATSAAEMVSSYRAADYLSRSWTVSAAGVAASPAVELDGWDFEAVEESDGWFPLPLVELYWQVAARSADDLKRLHEKVTVHLWRVGVIVLLMGYTLPPELVFLVSAVDKEIGHALAEAERREKRGLS